ncbi:MAG: hypothetical protein ACE5I0_08155 [Candidatus Binatia bacterium]
MGFSPRQGRPAYPGQAPWAAPLKEPALYLFEVIGDDQLKFRLVRDIPLQIYPRGNLLVILISAGI